MLFRSTLEAFLRTYDVIEPCDWPTADETDHGYIDVDLGAFLKASGVGATVHGAWLLDSAAVSADLRAMGEALSLEFALAGGDDYELVFTAPAAHRQAVAAAAQATEEDREGRRISAGEEALLKDLLAALRLGL